MCTNSPVEQRLGYRIKRLQQALRHAMDATLAELNLTTAQYAALCALENDPGLSNAELARRCFVTPQTMHQVVTGLERAGLLTPVAHSRHSRIRSLTLTDAARDRLDRAHERVTNVEARMAADLTSQELTVTTQALEKCRSALEGY